MLKKIFWALLIIFALFQLYPRPAKNISEAPANADINMMHKLPDDVAGILKSSCYDCHSNNTRYPWYTSIQPVALWLDDHIQEGKAELNFSEFANYTPARRYRKLEEIADEIEHGEMPLKSYTWIHRDAKLTDAQKQSVYAWVKNLRDEYNRTYSAEELTRKKK